MKRRYLWLLVAAVPGVLLGCSPESTSPPETPDAEPAGPSLAVNHAVKGRKVSLFLKYSASAPSDRLARVMAGGAAFANDIRGERVIAVDVLPSQVEALRRLPWVISSEVDTSRYFLVADVLPRGVNVSDAELVHSRGNRGAGVKVAFLDGGVQCSNPDLVGRIKGGYDFVLGNQNYCTTGAPARDNDFINHGTAVAQIIGGALNGQHFYGMAPEANLYSLRVCSADDDCTVARVSSALYWARDNGMQVVSASLANCGDGVSLSKLLAMSAVNSAGIPQAWAAGNGSGGALGDSFDCEASDPVSGSARVSYAIAVSAFDSRTGVAKSGYQYGPEIDISSPTDVEYIGISGGQGTFSGTSAATPHVAGALALLIKQRFSGVALLTERLTSTATPAGAAGKDNIYGYGKLNANAAVANLPSVMAIGGPASPIYTPGTYTLTAIVGNGLPPYAVKWDISYSNGIRPNVSTAYGSASYSLPVPGGSYSISVTATPKETKWLRVGNPLIRSFRVCPEEAALIAGVPSRGAPGGGDPVTPNAICPSQPPVDPL